MGNKNQKFRKNQNLKNHEREFDDMKRRIMSDVRVNKDRDAATREMEREHIETEHNGPVSRTSDFTNMIKEIVNENSRDDVTFRLMFGTKKASNGVVFVKMSIASAVEEQSDCDHPSTSETIIFYYTEDQSVNPKKKKLLQNYMGSVMVINQASGNVLFNRFGYDCIEKARPYIENIIQKNIERALPQADQEEPAEEATESAE